jgi:hypothetical protein
MHQRSSLHAPTNRPAPRIGRFGLRVLGSKFVTGQALWVCLLLVVCLRHAVASITV